MPTFSRLCAATYCVQETIGGVSQTVGSFGERCQCDNSTGAEACPVAMNETCSGMYNICCAVYLDQIKF